MYIININFNHLILQIKRPGWKVCLFNMFHNTEYEEHDETEMKSMNRQTLKKRREEQTRN